TLPSVPASPSSSSFLSPYYPVAPPSRAPRAPPPRRLAPPPPPAGAPRPRRPPPRRRTPARRGAGAAPPRRRAAAACRPLLRGAHLCFDESCAAAREDVVVVEDGRAPRQRELCETATRGRVHHLVVDPRPDRVERLQPGEEVGVGGPGARERLVEVVVGVDEARRDHGAAQVFAALGCVAGSERRDHAVLDLQPAAGVLAVRVVHRDQPAVLDDHGPASSAASGTSPKRSTSTRPRSVS